ncbi:hypothetical protein QM565_32505 [Geitlerinema splendidum]|nr:hypothetical protein [Geitlerinema splendidum]
MEKRDAFLLPVELLEMLFRMFIINGGEITVPYKACMQELSMRRHNCCASLPSLNFPLDKIKEVRIEKTLVKGWRGRIRQLFLLNYDGHTHKNLGRKKKLV